MSTARHKPCLEEGEDSQEAQHSRLSDEHLLRRGRVGCQLLQRVGLCLQSRAR